jgi:alpha-L-fucosidase 2
LEIFATRFVLRNSFHANGDQTKSGISNFTYRPFTLEGNFAYAAGLQEMLLQSHTGVIEVFPAVPASWKALSFSTLRAQGGWLVSAQRDDAGAQSVRVEATKDGVAKVKSWVDSSVIELPMKAGEVATLKTDADATEIELDGPK